MKNKTVVCTLFEGSYHHGVAALSNSLYNTGFRGCIYAGFKGSLPSWANTATENLNLKWANAKTFKVAEGLEIHFLPLNTKYHLTNYKPDFMLQLLDGPAKDAEGIFYFDPDIVVKCQWSFFEDWIEFGIALVHEITSNDMPPNHPLRKKWEEVILKANKEVKRSIHSYINGGFCGVHIKYKTFLQDWIDITQTGMKYFQLTADQWKHDYDREYIFYAQDQDALNITAMSTECPISEMGPDGMDFIHGGFIMSHSVGSPKPWAKHFLSSAFKGEPPSWAEKEFWKNKGLPIETFSTLKRNYKYISIKIASFIGRFYRKY